jgi:hypothetical protein
MQPGHVITASWAFWGSGILVADETRRRSLRAPVDEVSQIVQDCGAQAPLAKPQKAQQHQA